MATNAKSLKIGLVLDDTLDTPDGVQQYVLAIGEWLRSQGHDVHYLVGQTTRQDILSIHSLSRNLKVRFNGNRMSMPLPTSHRRLREFLQREQFDVLHVQVPYSPYMAHRLIIDAPAGTAIVGTFHILPNSIAAHAATRALSAWTWRSRKRFDMMLSVSPAAQVFARKVFKVESIVLPNVIDYQRFHQAEPLIAHRKDEQTILFLGRLVPRKGCMLLLKAIEQLSQEPNLPVFRVIVCGKGPLLDRLQQYSVTHGIADKVVFEGFVSEEDKPGYYASADISVFPSNGGESFGIVLLEAMASGKSAVLAGDNPGYHSVMNEREDLLFDPRSVDALSDKLREFLTNQELKSHAANWGERYSTQFDRNFVGKQLLDYYAQALHKRDAK